ncbi:MAG: DUF2007 domain-containing protein [Candidatus Omnitrophica bacterium]|nr:DUF2007 domain-containing protein [Candidatus Omnitrophota bacterium]
MSELIPIRAFYHKYEAQIVQGLLKDNGIESMISADDCGGYRPHLSLGTGNNRLLVKQTDVEQAKIILETLDQPLSNDELNRVAEPHPATSPYEQPSSNPQRSIFVTLGTLLIFIPPLIIILVVFYFLFLR